MSRSIHRAVVACVLVSLSALSARADDASNPGDTAAATREPVTLTLDDRGATAWVAPPSRATSTKAPMLLLLHGMCDTPENECPAFAGSATSDRLVVCPRAELACPGGGVTWSAKPDARARVIEETLAKTRDTWELDPARRTLVGFSLGAFVALDVAQRQKGGWKNLVLIGARVQPDAKKLREAGVERVLLASGRHDMTRDHMIRVAKRLEADGVKATYRSLGPVGHRFAPDMNAWLEGALTWLERGDEG